MPTDAQMAQRKKDLLAAEMAARRKLAEATVTNLMTGETMPMPGLLADPVETTRPQTTESLNRANLNTMLNAADRNPRYGVDWRNRKVINPEDYQQHMLQTMIQDRPDPADVEMERRNLGLIPKEEPVQQQQTQTRPYWDSIESRMGKNIRNIVGDARADEMEMDLFGPAVTPGVATRSPTTQRKVATDSVNRLTQIKRQKNILRAVSSIWGTKDNSASYEASALNKYVNQLDQQAAKQVLSGGIPTSSFQVLSDYMKAGGSLDGGIKLANALKSTDDTKPINASLANSDDFTPESRQLYLRTKDPADLQLAQPGSKTLSLDEKKYLRELRKNARDDARKLIDNEIKAIRLVEDARGKVKRTAKAPSAEEVKIFKERYGIGKEVNLNEGIRDIALINAYQRMIDPATVREGDVALQRASAPFFAQIKLAAERLAEGKFLDDNMRAEMSRLADNFYYEYLASRMPDITATKEIFSSTYAGPTGDKILSKKEVDVDFARVVPQGSYKRWQAFVEDNPHLKYVEGVQETEEARPPISAADYQALIEAAAEEGVSVEEYLEVLELRRRKAAGQ